MGGQRRESIRSSRHYPQLEYEKHPDEDSSCQDSRISSSMSMDTSQLADRKLAICFCLLVVFGAANRIFGKLQAVPMYNYPNFLNLFGVILYIPLCFAYIIPVSRFGLLNNAICAEQLALPKRPFVIMGCLDCLASMMQIFSSVYLPGPLLILIPQAAIPITMLLSNLLLNQRYRAFQYAGAMIVLVGILVVLEPLMSHRHAPDFVCQAMDNDRDCSICQIETDETNCLSHRLDVPDDLMKIFASQRNHLWTGISNATMDDDDEGTPICEWVSASSSTADEEILILIWSGVLILSCMPMALSSIYKEIALGDDLELDPIFMNGWIAIFQFFFSILLAVPAGYASSPPIGPMELPRNIYHGLLCYFGRGSIDTGCHPDNMCSFHAALFVNMSLLMNCCYNLLMMYTLKYGSASLLYVALTVMVPIGNFAFALPFMPQRATVRVSDLLGLGVIMSGLVLYRFADRQKDSHIMELTESREEESSRASLLREPLVTGEVGDV